MDVTDLPLLEQFNFNNAVLGNLSIPATASFKISWAKNTSPAAKVSLNDPVNMFQGEFVRTTATVDWSATNADGFTFESDPGGQVTVLAEVGTESNGVFF